MRECIEDDEDVMVTEDIGADSARITFGKGESDRQRKISAMAAAEGAVVEEDARYTIYRERARERRRKRARAREKQRHRQRKRQRQRQR